LISMPSMLELFTILSSSIGLSDNTILASWSTIAFCLHRMHVRLTSSKLFMRQCTSCRYRCIRSSFASYSPFTCPMISLESLWTSNDVVPSVLAILNPTSNASYSASLLVAEYCNLMAWLITPPSSGTSTTPSPSAIVVDDPSILTFHYRLLWVSSFAGSFAFIVNSSMKSAKA
jgi:hypothetical protein